MTHACAALRNFVTDKAVLSCCVITLTSAWCKLLSGFHHMMLLLHSFSSPGATHWLFSHENASHILLQMQAVVGSLQPAVHFLLTGLQAAFGLSEQAACGWLVHPLFT